MGMFDAIALGDFSGLDEAQRAQALRQAGLLQMGLGILGANKRGVPLGQVLSGGIMSGMNNAGALRKQAEEQGERQRKVAQENAQRQALSAMFGGVDSKGISWNGPRPGLMQGGVPTAQGMQMLGQAFPTQYAQQALESAFAKPAAGKLLTPEEEAQAIRVRAAGRQAPAPDNTLVEIYDANSPTGTRMVPRAQAAGQPGRPGSGLSFKTNPDGTVEVIQGRGAGQPGGLTTASTTRVQEKEFNADERLARLDVIEKAYDPSLLTWSADIERAMLTAGDKAGVLGAEGKAQLTKYVNLRRTALSNLNQYLNELSGAAITVQEMGRLRQAMPDPEKDGPTEFKAKLLGVTAEARAAVLRHKATLGAGQGTAAPTGKLRYNVTTGELEPM